MTDLGYDQAMQLRSALMPIAYLLCTTGLILAVFRHWGNFHEVLMSIVGIGVIVILLNGYPTALTTVADGFKTLRDQTTANAPGNAQSWTQVFDAQFEQPSWDQVAEKIEIAICQMFKWIGKIAIWFLDWVQSWAFNGLIAISPILLGGLAVPWTQGTGITFLTTSFGVAAWHLGIALVDILLASIATQLFAAVGIGGGVAAAATISVGLLPIFLGALAAIVCVAIALYLAVPITQRLRLALFARYIDQLYTDTYEDWARTRHEELMSIATEALAVTRCPPPPTGKSQSSRPKPGQASSAPPASGLNRGYILIFSRMRLIPARSNALGSIGPSVQSRKWP
jgi:hypothetical protein